MKHVVGMGRPVRGVGALCVVVLGACYRYAPMDAAPAAGAAVRMHLTEGGAAQMAPVLGAGTTSVTGRVLSATDTGLVLAVTETGRNGGERVTWSGERIAVPSGALASAERRSLHPWRTLGVAGVGVAAGALIAAIVSALDSSSGGDDGGPIIIPP